MTSSNLNEMTTPAGGTKGKATDPCDDKHDEIWKDIDQRAKNCHDCLQNHSQSECTAKPGTPCWGIDVDRNHSWPEWVVMGIERGAMKSSVLFAADRQISGIECHRLWENLDGDKYWEYAWRVANSSFYSTLTQQEAGLAMNAYVDQAHPCRRHNQLHIHICSIATRDATKTPPVDSLRYQLEGIEKTGKPHPITKNPAELNTYTYELSGHDDKGNPKKGAYRILILETKYRHPFHYEDPNHKEANLFHLVRYNAASGKTEAEKDADMANQSLVVCQRYVNNQPAGFYIVNGCHALGSCAGTDLLWLPNNACQ